MPPLRGALTLCGGSPEVTACRSRSAVTYAQSGTDNEPAADFFAWCEEDAVALASDGGKKH